VALVDVIVVHHQRNDLTARCLEALAADTELLRSVTVVDSGSTPPWRAIDAGACGVRYVNPGHPGRWPTLHLLHLQENVGYAEGNNQGLAARLPEGATYYLILNNDAYVTPGTLRAMVAASETTGAGMVVPAVYRADDPDRVDRFGLTLTRSGAAYDRESEEDGPLLCPSGCAAMYRRDVVLDLIEDEEGFFDRSFGAYAEDLDTGLRARARGYGVSFAPDAVVYHQGSASFGPGSRFAHRLRHRNTLCAVAKNYSTGLLITEGPLLLAGQLLGLLNAVRRGRFMAVSRGKVEGGLRAFGARWRTRGRPRLHTTASLDPRFAIWR
jgi:N-acetylglucosaminyl-diphospho-decaprenol L-rhamnosyltransferase